MRLLCVVEQFPEMVQKVIDRLGAAHSSSSGRQTAQWLVNEWVHLVVADPVSHELRVLKNRKMVAYKSHHRRAAVESAVH